jgi:hypothetical protein
MVNNLLPTFFLRRMKSLIADQLPNKSDRVVFCPLSDTQADAYQKLIDSDFIQYIRRSAEMCECGSNKQRGWCHFKEIPGFEGKWQHHVFPAIATLQKLANHFALLIPSGNDSHEKQEKDLRTLQIAAPETWPDLYRQKDSILNFANQEFCGKWKILRRLLEFWSSNGDKVLVFSHSVRLLKMLQMLFATTTSYSISYLDGSLTYEERTLAVNDFNSNPNQFVFLISTRAGGVGLNITSANKVVVVDPNWNPSFDLQAQDRAYRIGQTRDVEVFRLVSAGTIEEIVYARQIYKQQQANIGYNASLERRYFEGVQNQTKKKGEIFGLENLFAYQSDQVVLREIVNKTNVAESKAGVLVAGIDIDGEDDDDESNDGGVGGALRLGKDEDREDAAMSQLADLIASGGGPKKKRLQKVERKMDGVQWILAKAGVQYTHENSEVVGTSKIESKLSKRAMEHSTDTAANTTRVFASESQTGDAQLRVPKTKAGGRSPGLSYHDDRNESVLDIDDNEFHAVRFQYRPAEDVRKRQFCSMAKHFGYDNATDFAVVVEGWTQAQRRNCLDSFYRVRREEVILPDITQ